MKSIRLLLYVMMMCLSLSALAQSKGQMAFTSSSPNANKLLRSAWVDLADFKLAEGNNTIQQLLKEDPDCGMAYASLFTFSHEERQENLKKAGSMKLSADERMLLEGIMARLEQKSTQEHFAPLMKKYPSDDYLHLVIMFNSEPEKALQIGETIIRKKSKLAPTYNMLGYLYMARDDMAKAEAHFDKYILLRPDLANPYDSKADFMMRTGKLEEAAQLYEKAAALGMTDAKHRAEAARAQLKFPKPSDSDAATIRQIITSCFEALKESNVDNLLKDYSEHAIDMLANQRVNVGLPNIRKRFSYMFAEGSAPKLSFTIESVNGTGPIAIAHTKNDFVWKEAASGKETERKNSSIYILRKGQDGKWKVLANHYHGWNEDATPISNDDEASIKKVLAGWDAALKPGEELSAKNFDAFSALHSAQAIEIFSDQMSNIGLANLRSRWEQFTGAKMETNSLSPLGIEGAGRRAIAWGIGNQNFYLKDSQELQKFQFPWAMILTKEKDDTWRILATHWGAD